MSDQNVCSGCQDSGTCGGSCEKKPESLLEAANVYSSVKRVIAVVSGKGGVANPL